MGAHFSLKKTKMREDAMQPPLVFPSLYKDGISKFSILKKIMNRGGFRNQFKYSFRPSVFALIISLESCSEIYSSYFMIIT